MSAWCDSVSMPLRPFSACRTWMPCSSRMPVSAKRLRASSSTTRTVRPGQASSTACAAAALRLLGADQRQHVARLLGGQVQGDALAQFVQAGQELQRPVPGTGPQRCSCARSARWPLWPRTGTLAQRRSRRPGRPGSRAPPSSGMSSSRTTQWQRSGGQRARPPPARPTAVTTSTPAAWPSPVPARSATALSATQGQQPARALLDDQQTAPLLGTRAAGGPAAGAPASAADGGRTRRRRSSAASSVLEVGACDRQVEREGAALPGVLRDGDRRRRAGGRSPG